MPRRNMMIFKEIILAIPLRFCKINASLQVRKARIHEEGGREKYTFRAIVIETGDLLRGLII